MANKKFVMTDGIKVGPVTINPVTGDITTTGNIIVVGSGSFYGSGVTPTPAPTPTPTPDD